MKIDLRDPIIGLCLITILISNNLHVMLGAVGVIGIIAYTPPRWYKIGK